MISSLLRLNVINQIIQIPTILIRRERLVFFTLSYKDIKPMPEFVKNILFACGISCFFKYDTNQMILDMEKFIKEDTVLRNSIPRTQHYSSISFIRIYEFRFLPGHGHLAILKLAQTAVEKKLDFYTKFLFSEIHIHQKLEKISSQLLFLKKQKNSKTKTTNKNSKIC